MSNRNWNQKPQATGQGYIYTQNSFVENCQVKRDIPIYFARFPRNIFVIDCHSQSSKPNEWNVGQFVNITVLLLCL